MLSKKYNKLRGSNLGLWYGVFEQLETDTQLRANRLALTSNIGPNQDNYNKNQYCNVFPYDQNRCELSSILNGSTDYVNASPVSVPEAKRKYILTQEPLRNTMDHFWRLAYDEKVPAIVMLHDRHEKGYYFPTSKRPQLNLGECIVSLESEDVMDGFVVRRINVVKKDNDLPHQVWHFHYTSWEDYGVPESTEHLVRFIRHIKNSKVSSDLDSSPLLIHCLAGIGRTGTFTLIDAVVRMVELGVNQDGIDIHKTLVDMRMQRMNLIQTPEQLQFAWKAIIDAIGTDVAA